MSQAFSTGPHPFGTDLRSAMIADADDVVDDAADGLALVAFDGCGQGIVLAHGRLAP